MNAVVLTLTDSQVGMYLYFNKHLTQDDLVVQSDSASVEQTITIGGPKSTMVFKSRKNTILSRLWIDRVGKQGVGKNLWDSFASTMPGIFTERVLKSCTALSRYATIQPSTIYRDAAIITEGSEVHGSNQIGQWAKLMEPDIAPWACDNLPIYTVQQVKDYVSLLGESMAYGRFALYGKYEDYSFFNLSFVKGGICGVIEGELEQLGVLNHNEIGVPATPAFPQILGRVGRAPFNSFYNSGCDQAIDFFYRAHNLERPADVVNLPLLKIWVRENLSPVTITSDLLEGYTLRDLCAWTVDEADGDAVVMLYEKIERRTEAKPLRGWYLRDEKSLDWLRKVKAYIAKVKDDHERQMSNTLNLDVFLLQDDCEDCGCSTHECFCESKIVDQMQQRILELEAELADIKSDNDSLANDGDDLTQDILAIQEQAEKRERAFVSGSLVALRNELKTIRRMINDRDLGDVTAYLDARIHLIKCQVNNTHKLK